MGRHTNKQPIKLMHIVEERPEENDPSVYRTNISETQNMKSPTHSQVDS